MVDLRSVLIGVVVLLIIYLIYIYFFSKNHTKLADIHNAQSSKEIHASKLPSGMSDNYMYSIWFYVNHWNYRYGESKIIFGRKDAKENPAPKVEFASGINNIHIKLAIHNKDQSGGSSGDSSETIHTCSIENVPLQAWTNLIMSVNNRALDVYLDGKLVRTCVLPGVPTAAHGKNIHLTPDGGFSGYTSNFVFKPSAINPREAYDIYKNGYGGGGIGSFFNKYRLKFAFMEDNKEVNSVEI